MGNKRTATHFGVALFRDNHIASTHSGGAVTKEDQRSNETARFRFLPAQCSQAHTVPRWPSGRRVAPLTFHHTKQGTLEFPQPRVSSLVTAHIFSLGQVCLCRRFSLQQRICFLPRFVAGPGFPDLRLCSPRAPGASSGPANPPAEA